MNYEQIAAALIRQKRLAAVRLAAYVLIIEALAVMAFLLEAGKLIWAGAFCVGILLAVAALLFDARRTNRRLVHLEPYRFSVCTDSVQEIVNVLDLWPLDAQDGPYYRLCRSGSLSLRVLLIDARGEGLEAAKKQMKADNRAINKQHSVKTVVPVERARRSVRMNLLVFRNETPDEQKWFGRDAAVLLNRTENIINAAVFLDSRSLVIPPIRQQVEYGAIRNYIAALDYLSVLIDRDVFN